MIDLPAFLARNYRHYDSFCDLTPAVPYFTETLRVARDIIAAKAGVGDLAT